MTIWIYIFEDGTRLELINNGLSMEELKALQKIHGAVTVDFERRGRL